MLTSQMEILRVLLKDGDYLCLTLYHTQPRPIIANYTALNSRQLKQNRWISRLAYL